MFDTSRLNPKRVIPAIERRLKEIPHLFKWNFSTLGLENKKSIKRIKDIHKNETLYLIANGPSINKTNLHLLKDKTTMCMNRFYIKFNSLDFVPNYLVCIEETVLDQFFEDFNSLEIQTFVNWRARKKIKNSIYLKESFSLFPFFQRDITKPTNAGGTVTFVCLQLANYMGFKKVVILGMDHFFKEKGIAGKSEVRTQERDESHFDPNYFPKGIKWLLPDLVKSEYSYKIANDFYLKNGKEIIDATIDGKCEIFKKDKLENHLNE